MPNSTQAQKEERRRRFFAAISKDTAAQKPQSTKSSTKASSAPKSKATQGAPSSTASSSTGTASSPFSAATTAKLMDVQRDILANPEQLKLPDDSSIIPRDYLIAYMQKFANTPPEDLPPEFRQWQRKAWASQDSLAELRRTPLEQVPPNLKELKRNITAYDAQMPPDPTAELKQRVNELLRTNGEHEYPFDEIASCPPGQGTSGKAWGLETVARARLRELKLRKPQLHAQVMHLFRTMLDAMPPDIELKFKDTMTWDKPDFIIPL